MITKFTPCGKRLLFDDDMAERLDGYSFYFHGCLKAYTAVDTAKGYRNTLNALLYGGDRTVYHVHKNGDEGDFRAENVERVPRSVMFRARPPRGGSQYKGLNIDKKTQVIRAVVYLGDRKTLQLAVERLPAHPAARAVVLKKAAGVYNAALDYLGLDGYRNDVPPVALNSEQIAAIERRLNRSQSVEVVS